KRALGEIIDHQARDSRFDFATVTEVELSADFRYARVFVSLPGDRQKQEAAVEKFNQDEGFFRSLLAEEVDPRYTPELDFVLDDRIDKVARIEHIVSEEEGEDE
ncbi:MAG: 30S ribosome-binding factor RbfA, partial [Candidatus Bipolaricaulota bacterium]